MGVDTPQPAPASSCRGSMWTPPARGGGGVLGLEKGTNCGPAAAERWPSQPKMA